MAELGQVALGAPIDVGHATIEEFDRLVRDVDQGLLEEGQQDGVAPLVGRALQCLGCGAARQLGQELAPVGREQLLWPRRHSLRVEERALGQGLADGGGRVARGAQAQPDE